jgi:hypothetical protein
MWLLPSIKPENGYSTEFTEFKNLHCGTYLHPEGILGGDSYTLQVSSLIRLNSPSFSLFLIFTPYVHYEHVVEPWVSMCSNTQAVSPIFARLVLACHPFQRPCFLISASGPLSPTPLQFPKENHNHTSPTRPL